MIAGGLGTIGADMTEKIVFPAGTLLVQLGGPGMRIGMGGGAASLDGGRRQRRRARLRLGAARQPRDRAPRPGSHQPLLGARRRTTRSWRSTTSARAACPTPSPSWSTTPAAARASTCARCRSRRSGLAPKEIWCNESQERYVLALAPESLPLFAALCERERCPYAVVGVARDDGRLVLGDGPDDRDDEDRAIDMPMDVLLGKPPKMHARRRRASRAAGGSLDLTGVDLRDGRVSTCCATRRSPPSAS